MQSISFDEIVQGGVVRVKDGDIPMISIIDVIKLITSKDSKRSSETLINIQNNLPDVSENIGNFQFPGQGQRPTPVADLDTILIILQHLPGPSAQKYREMVAVKLRNELAKQESNDDITRIAKKTKDAKGNSFQIPQNDAQTSLQTNQVPQASLVSTNQDPIHHMEIEVTVSKLKKEKASIDLEILAMAKDAFVAISPDHELCPTAVNLLKDQVANIVKVCGVNPNQANLLTSQQGMAVQRYEESPFHPITISDRMQALGYRFNTNQLLKASKLISEEYSKAHGKKPLKDKRMIDGAFRDVNVFSNQDIPILDLILHRLHEEVKRDESQLRMDSYLQTSQ